MVLIKSNSADMDDSMPQIVPSAGFTPPCDYNNFADFDLSLLPGGDLPLSPSTLLYSPHSGTLEEKPKIFTSFYPSSPEQETSDIDLGPDFNKLLPESQTHPPSPNCGIYLEVPSSKNYHANSPIGALSPYSPLLSPNYQEQSIYANSPDASIYQSPYSKSPRDDYQYIKKEYQNSPIYLPGLIQIKEEVYLSPLSSPHQVETPDVFELLQSSLLEKQVKQESTVDFGHLLQAYSPAEPQIVPQASPQDHQLLREVLRDTSFQKKYNIKPFDFGFMSQDIKMEDASQKDLMSCNDKLIEPVLQKAMEQERKAADSTCAALNISGDISKWTPENVFAWMQWTSNELNLPMLEQEQWKIDGQTLVNLTEDEFTKRSPQGGNILYAKLEVWKAAYMEDESMQWQPETTSSNASSGGDISDEDEDEPSPQAADTKPSTSRTTGGSHIHLWQFLKELLASPQVHGSCIRWLDRNSGVFKIEDSVKVAKLWGKRKNRPAMNYDKLSRSIRQYYKKGIMKKTERSQRLVYQFCHPYCL